MKRILIVGATSAIAEAAARRFAAEGAALALLARDPDKLEAVATDLSVRGAEAVHAFTFDAGDPGAHGRVWEEALAALGSLDAVLVAHGTLPDQGACQASPEQTLDTITVNFLSPVAVLTRAGEYFEHEGRGCIAVISSVAGLRGRPSNYVYGSAKGGVTLFAEGLRARLAKKGVSVVTILPGFVDTPMTAHLPKGLLWASADSVGRAVHRAMKRGRDTVYTPWFWRWIMLVIRLIPSPIFKRLDL